MSGKCLDAEKTNEYLKNIIMQGNGDQAIVEVMLKGWIEHVWKEHGGSCISQIVKSILALAKEEIIPEDCSRRMNVYLMGLDWDFAAHSGPAKDSAVEREDPGEAVNPSSQRSDLDIGQNGEATARLGSNQGDPPLSCRAHKTAGKDTDSGPRQIMELELEALTGVIQHKNSGVYQGRMKENAVKILREYWPQGFNSRKMPVMIASEFEEITHISKKTSREISFAPINEELHKSLINRMQTACCLRLLFSEANTSKIGNETFLRLGYRTIRSLVERVVTEQRALVKDPTGAQRNIALAWGEKNLKAVLENQAPEWVVEAEQWALASLETIDEVEASVPGDQDLPKGESSSGETTTLHNRVAKGKRRFEIDECNRITTPKKRSKESATNSPSASKQGGMTPPLTRSMAVVQHHQLQQALELSMSGRGEKR